MDDLCKIANLAIMICFLGAGCTGSANSNTVQAAASDSATVLSGNGLVSPDGKQLFRQYCIMCHGSDGKLGLNGAKDLDQSVLSIDDRVNIVTNGKNMMTPFKELLEPAEIEAVAKYTFTLRR